MLLLVATFYFWYTQEILLVSKQPKFHTLPSSVILCTLEKMKVGMGSAGISHKLLVARPQKCLLM